MRQGAAPQIADLAGGQITMGYTSVAAANLKILHAAAVKALSSPEMQQKLVEQGGIPSPGTPDAFRSLIVADSAKFAQIIKDVGIPMEG